MIKLIHLSCYLSKFGNTYIMLSSVSSMELKCGLFHCKVNYYSLMNKFSIGFVIYIYFGSFNPFSSVRSTAVRQLLAIVQFVQFTFLKSFAFSSFSSSLISSFVNLSFPVSYHLSDLSYDTLVQRCLN